MLAARQAKSQADAQFLAAEEDKKAAESELEAIRRRAEEQARDYQLAKTQADKERIAAKQAADMELLAVKQEIKAQASEAVQAAFKAKEEADAFLMESQVEVGVCYKSHI